MDLAANKGFLKEDFRIFHLRDQRQLHVEAHFHEFDKVVIPLSGSVTYTVEGTDYELRRGDVLFIRHHDVHRSHMSGKSIYDRIILWADPDFLKSCKDDGGDLERCFEQASNSRTPLYRPYADDWEQMLWFAHELEENETDTRFGQQLVRNAYFALLMTELNRCVLNEMTARHNNADSHMDVVIKYINDNISGNLVVDDLAAMCYLSRYYFMRRFKEITGYTVHGYIQLKRLTLAADLLENGESAGDAAAKCGFGDYSTFLRAFIKQYGVAPSRFTRMQRPGMASAYRE